MAKDEDRVFGVHYSMFQRHSMGRINIRVFHLMLLLVPIAVSLSLATWFVRAFVQASRETGQSVCEGRLFFIGAELANYRDRHGHLPPICTFDGQGRPMHSWRAMLYAEMNPTFRQAYDFSQPWDSPSNIRLAENPPKIFCCGNNQRQPAHFTNYVCLVDPARGIGGYIYAHGQTQTQESGLVLAEHPDSQILWTQPRDLSLNELSSITHGEDPEGIAILLTDRTVCRVSKEQLISFVNQGKKKVHPDEGHKP